MRLASTTTPDAVILSLRSHGSATGKFLLLNSRIDQLTKEIRERKALQAANTALLRSEQAARHAAEQANRVKDEFLAILSHELRTPLNAILGWANLLETNELDYDSRVSGLQAIQRSARAQASMINDILDVSRIIAGKIRLNLRQCELAELLASALDTVRPAATAKNITLNSSINCASSIVTADAERLQQVLWNLISNAIKFTPQDGSIHVDVGRSDTHIQIKIVDTGIGISPEVLPFIFDRFRQADSSSTRRHGGLGLGLAIAQQLVDLHGGSLSASSAGEGMGSTFTVLLPSHLSGRAQQPQLQPPTASTTDHLRPSAKLLQLAGARLLLVEDDQESREMLFQVLRQLGAEVRATASVQDALSAVETFQPDCVISDIEMPDEDGYSLIRTIRFRERGGKKFLPAVAVTAYARAQDRIRALEAGFQMHVPKPIEINELVAVLMTLLGRPLIP